jgi:hypothetical protein
MEAIIMKASTSDTMKPTAARHGPIWKVADVYWAQLYQ